MPIAKYEWTSKKPSIVSLKKSIKEAVKTGSDYIQLTWGENEITLEKLATGHGWMGPWTGHGWIGRHGGSDLADQLNKEIRNAHD
jgi:hypothetical protein